MKLRHGLRRLRPAEGLAAVGARRAGRPAVPALVLAAQRRRDSAWEAFGVVDVLLLAVRRGCAAGRGPAGHPRVARAAGRSRASLRPCGVPRRSCCVRDQVADVPGRVHRPLLRRVDRAGRGASSCWPAAGGAMRDERAGPSAHGPVPPTLESPGMIDPRPGPPRRAPRAPRAHRRGGRAMAGELVGRARPHREDLRARPRRRAADVARRRRRERAARRRAAARACRASVALEQAPADAATAASASPAPERRE